MKQNTKIINPSLENYSRRVLQITNITDNGTISPFNAWVYPAEYGANMNTKYVFQFIPTKFEQGMVIRITLPT
jgi:hypothetical protein